MNEFLRAKILPESLAELSYDQVQPKMAVKVYQKKKGEYVLFTDGNVGYKEKKTFSVVSVKEGMPPFTIIRKGDMEGGAIIVTK